MARQAEAIRDAYWAGEARPDEERLALRRAEAVLDDWFTASAEDFAAMMETDDGE